MKRNLKQQILAGALAVTLLTGCAGLPEAKDTASQPAETTSAAQQNAHFEKIAEGFRAMGIDVSDEVVRQCGKNYDSIPKDAKTSQEGQEQDIFLTELMRYYGSKPVSGALYCFPAEVTDTSCMMEDFFKGVMSICGDLFTIEMKQKELVSHNTIKKGIYDQKIIYKVNGLKYEYTISVNQDRFDVGIIPSLNEAIAVEQYDQRLYYDCRSDIIMVCWCMEDWANEFNEKTGFHLS